MAIIRGFRGLRYNSEKIDDFNSIVAPPYDVISESQQNELYEANPYNVIRIDLARGEGEERYVSARNTFRQWIDENVLVREEESSIYPYYQEFEFEGKRHTRKGFIAAVKVEDFEKKTVLPHEMTFKKHKDDRLKLTHACNANLSQVFAVYSDSEGSVEDLIDSSLEEPIIEVTTPEGVINRLWKISDPKILKRVSEGLGEKSLLIADGHHRYETAINYRNLQREAEGESNGEKPYDYTMMYLSRGEGDGLIINPTHRALRHLGTEQDDLIRGLNEQFNVEPSEPGEAAKLGFNEIMLVLPGGVCYRLTPLKSPEKQSENLAVMLLHNVIFTDLIDEKSAGILYTKSEGELLELVESGGYEAGFLLPKLNAGDIFEVVFNGTKMPHKSTYFYPKILSGMVFNPLW